MFRRVRFECGTCGEGFVDWHDDDWERAPVFCVNCGERIAPGEPVESRASERPSRAETASESALGVLKPNQRRSFSDTLPGLRSVPPPAFPDEAHDSSSEAQTETRPTAEGGPRDAQSAAPRPSPSAPTTPARRFAPLLALLVGFAAGIVVAELTADRVVGWLDPARASRIEQSQRFAEAAGAIDDGKLEHAEHLLDELAKGGAENETRMATLRARLALAFMLGNRRSDADRELALVAQRPRSFVHLAALRRIFEAVFPAPQAAAAVSHAAPTPVASAPEPAKPRVTRRELLTFARDRQHRAQLDLAERLYGEVLRVHPNDAEARCGLAEVQLLRGGLSDSAQLFARAVDDNPGYAPAWIGLADTDWLSGRPARAACRYRTVIDRFPTGSYPPYIQQRVAQVSNSGGLVQPARSNESAATACGD